MKQRNFFCSTFDQHPLYQPQAGHEEKASQGFNLAILQKCEAVCRQAFSKSQKILAVEFTLSYPMCIDTSCIGNECISDFTTRYCRVLREQRGFTADFIQVSELSPQTDRLHHHVVFLIGNTTWWRFVDYATVREIWRRALEHHLGWTGTPDKAPVHITSNWNGEGCASAYCFMADASRPEQVDELFRRLSYLAKNYSKNYSSGTRTFTSSKLQEGMQL